MIILLIIILSIIVNAAIFRLYGRHYRRETEGRNQRINALQSELCWRDNRIQALEACIRNNHIYIAELQHRCSRQHRPGPNFSDYDRQQGGVRVYLGRFWWN